MMRWKIHSFHRKEDGEFYHVQYIVGKLNIPFAQEQLEAEYMGFA